MKIGKYEIDKIYNEDCYKAIKNIPDDSIDLIVTDPPYEFETKGGGMLKEKRIYNMYNQIETLNLNKGINYDLLNEFIRVMKKPNIYIWCNKSQILDYMIFFIKENNCNFNIIIWHKTNAMPLCGSKYLSDCEYCLYFYKDIKLNTTYKTAHQIYNLPINLKDKQKYGHPTIKPLEIINNLIINSSNVNDIVLDCFMGSGTTAVACKENGRHFLGFEIDPKWYKVANDRLNKTNNSGQMSLFLD